MAEEKRPIESILREAMIRVADQGVAGLRAITLRDVKERARQLTSRRWWRAKG
jgi:hypothetical protein